MYSFLKAFLVLMKLLKVYPSFMLQNVFHRRLPVLSKIFRQ